MRVPAEKVREQISSLLTAWGMDADIVESAAGAIEGGDWGRAKMLPLLAPSVVGDERIVGWWRRYERMAATPNAAAAMLRAKD